jgi:hypothetical protein
MDYLNVNELLTTKQDTTKLTLLVISDDINTKGVHDVPDDSEQWYDGHLCPSSKNIYFNVIFSFQSNFQSFIHKWWLC